MILLFHFTVEKLPVCCNVNGQDLRDYLVGGISSLEPLAQDSDFRRMSRVDANSVCIDL
jgi:hypothetical protein